MKLIAMMLVKNEENRYLREILTDLEEYVGQLLRPNGRSL